VIAGENMAHTIKGKKRLLARVRRIKGQAEALEWALDQELECSAILQQIAAIRGAANGLMAEVLEGHLREHLGPDATDPLQRTDDLEHVISVLRSYMK
jgi:DNA-binding FrmR family transcriptional regulator